MRGEQCRERGVAKGCAAVSGENDTHILQPWGPDHDPEKYTYVAVWFDILYIRLKSGEWVVTSGGHHCTMAYLPWLPWRSREVIMGSNESIITDWKHGASDPLGRPHDLLTWRQCHITDPNDDTNYKSMPFYDMSHDVINEHLQNKTIHLARPVYHNGPDGETVEERNDVSIVRLWNRDNNRLDAAKRLESYSASHATVTGMVHLRLKNGIITEDSEVFTLLHYVNQNLIHHHRVHYLQPQHEIGLKSAESWHVTPQEDTNRPGHVAITRVTDADLIQLLNDKATNV